MIHQEEIQDVFMDTGLKNNNKYMKTTSKPETNVREWYIENFKDDEVGEDINKDVTFYDVFTALDTYKDVYELLGESVDTIIRERVFDELSRIMGVAYDEIYDKWMMGARIIMDKQQEEDNINS